MTRLSIPISEDIKSKLESRAAESGYVSLEAYIAALLNDEAKQIEFGAPKSATARTRAELETLVLEGLHSPASEMSSKEWQEIRADLIARHRPAKAG